MSGTSRDPQTKGERTRDAIRAAAEECFREFGFEVTSAEIARRAGVVEGTIFLHYRNKLGLLEAVTRDFYDILQAQAEETAAFPADAVTKLRRLVDGWAAHLETDWNLISVFVQRAQIAPESDLAGTVHSLSRRYTRVFVAVLEQLQASGQIDNAVPATLLRDIIFGTLEHTARGQLAAGKPIRTRAAAHQVLELALASADPSTENDSGLAAIDAKLDQILARLER